MQWNCILIQEYLLSNQALYLHVQLEIELMNRFLNKASVENDINKLITTKWTPMTGFKYSTNKQGLNRHYTEGWETKQPWLRYALSDDSAFCANVIALCGQISETTLEIAKSGFRDEKTGDI